jgi:hypothetical protein
MTFKGVYAMESLPHLIIRGNPVDGFEYSGPFENAAAAALYGNTDPHNDGDWWIAPLHAPAQDCAGFEDADHEARIAREGR